MDIQVRYLYVADSSNSAIRRIDVGRPGYAVSTISTQVDTPIGLAIDNSNLNLYVSSYNSNVVYQISLKTRVLVLYAGTGGNPILHSALSDIYYSQRLSRWISAECTIF